MVLGRLIKKWRGKVLKFGSKKPLFVIYKDDMLILDTTDASMSKNEICKEIVSAFLLIVFYGSITFMIVEE